jgi:hypothetical protein
MAHEPTDTYRTPHEDPAEARGAPREAIGRFTAPLVGDVDVELGLGRPVHLELDHRALAFEPGSGLVVRAEDLPTVELRRVDVDLVDGVVRTESDALGPFFDRALTVALCSALRQTLGWRPGSSLADHAARRLPRATRAGELPVWAGRAFPRARAALHPETRLALDLRGDALELTLSRPGILRVLGLGLKIVMARWVFATQRVEFRAAGVGPLRRAVLALVAWALTRRLRARLPAAMRVPGYDLFADEQRREHVRALIAGLRGRDEPPPTSAAHPLAREGEGRKSGFAGVISIPKAAVFSALQSVAITADDMPEICRPLAKLPLGPFSGVALCTDRGGDVVLVKRSGGARLEATRGLYLFADPFPELAELRVARIVVDLDPDHGVGLDLQTEPPLGPLMRALVQRAAREHLLPRVPHQRLRDGGLLHGPDAAHHTLWQQSLGGERRLVLRTAAGADVELRHGDEALSLIAPEGLELVFEGLPLPPASLRRVDYRWADGALTVDGDPALGQFGQDLLAALARHRVAPRAPQGLGLHGAGAPDLDPAQERQYSAVLFDVPVPAVGRLQLRMDPADTLAANLGPAELDLLSLRGLLLVAPELGLSLQLRGARYRLPDRALHVDASPAPGPYVLALAGLCIEALAMPLLRRLVPLWPDVEEGARWQLLRPHTALLERLGLTVDVSLPPGAALTLRRAPDAFELGGTAPLQVDPVDVALSRVRWLPEGERLELVAQPPAGPLLHEALRRALARFTPEAWVRALAERLALPPPSPPPAAPPAPAGLPLLELPLPLVGPLTLHLGADLGVDLRLERGQAELRGAAVVRADGLGLQVAPRRATLTFLPLGVRLDVDPPAGELEGQLAAHALRELLAPLLRLCWPAGRPARGDRDVLLALGDGQPWGPLELCVARGGALELRLDQGGLALRAEPGLFFAGAAAGWLPDFDLHALELRFADASVFVQISGIVEQHYHETAPVGPGTQSLVSHLLRALVLPRLPAWTQRLGLRVLPPPPPLPADPGRVAVWRAQLPGGYAKVIAAMDPGDVLTIRASRDELAFTSERGIHVDVPGLQLRLALPDVRYHMGSGEVQIGGLGQLENAFVEAALRRQLAHADPTAGDPETITLADLLDRFPVLDDGRRVLFADKLVRVLLAPSTTLVVRVEPGGLYVEADPPLRLDGVATADMLLAGLRYTFSDAAFQIHLTRGGLGGGILARLLGREGEAVLASVVHPLLPKAMRAPGYSLARDPDPSATLAALVRTLTLGKLGRFTAS